MGYRHYLHLITLEKVKEIRKANLQEVQQFDRENEDGDSWFRTQAVPYDPNIFEFGKLYHCDTVKRTHAKSEPLFDKFAVQDHHSDYQPRLVGKDGLEEIIQCIREKIIESYKEDMALGDAELLAITRENMKKKLYIWENRTVKADQVADDWQWEYAIANLRHILLTTNWDTHRLVFLGW